MPININAVLHQIQRLEMDSLLQAEPAVQQYFEHYGIDFADTISGVSQHIGRFHSGNYDLVCQLYLREDARATVFMLHGYFDHVGLYGPLISHLLARRYNVVAFDLPGHGLSSGEAASIASFSHYDRALEDCVRLCRGHLPEPWHLVGQSTGAAAVMSYLMREHRHPFDKIALLAPLVRPMHWQVGKWAHFGVSRFRTQIPRNFRENSHDLDFVEFVKEQDPLQSRYLKMDWIAAMGVWIKWFIQLEPSEQELLIIQGDADTTVDWRYNIKVIQQKFPGTTVFKVHRAKHHLVGESDEIRAGAFKALDRHLSGRKLPEEVQPAVKKRRFQRKT
jgi:lysophospholipase